ncbi:MAG: AAA family ATPase [Desulfotignum sp.]|nr:AAA family ATPase [Desulfotignum sp.]MCF8089164.1 AAA family ATPase [Desulfotignum sp.]MCF8138393.1 AAA family ATPase [Desulfotignum sp.]
MNTEKTKTKKKGIPRIESLKVENFRALKKVSLDKLTPMTVLLGPNGSGKSTVFDVFNFLSECFQYGLRHAWDRRGRARELKSRGAEGPILFELKYREQPGTPIITYHLAIDEGKKGPEVVEEWLKWRRGSTGQPFRFIEFKKGVGKAASGEAPDVDDVRIDSNLRSPDLIAVNTLGQFSEHPRVAALREFITDWYVSYLSIDQTRNQPEAGPQERLSKNGDNLPNVVQFLKEQHPDRLETIFDILRQRIPCLEQVYADPMPDGRLLLQIKDAPFEKPVLAKFASDGTMKMLAYLTVLYDPEPPRFIGIEEPENFLHPRLLPELAEECRAAAQRSQLFITTHSPFLLNAMRPEEVRVIYRDNLGFSRIVKASDIQGVPEMTEAGGALGHLWMEGHFGLGDPLVKSGAPGSGESAGGRA